MCTLQPSVSHSLYEEKVKFSILLLLSFIKNGASQKTSKDHFCWTDEKEQEETYSQLYDSGYITKPKSSSQMLEIERGGSTFLPIS